MKLIKTMLISITDDLLRYNWCVIAAQVEDNEYLKIVRQQIRLRSPSITWAEPMKVLPLRVKSDFCDLRSPTDPFPLHAPLHLFLFLRPARAHRSDPFQLIFSQLRSDFRSAHAPM